MNADLTAPARRPARQSIWTPLAIILLFGVFLVAAVLSTPPPEPIPYDLDGAHARGLLGLRLWLEELGYSVQRIDGLRFTPPDEATLIFVYPNQLAYSTEEAAALRAWVAAGNTAVIVGPDEEDRALIETFGVRLAGENVFESTLAQTQPLIPDGAAEYEREWFMPAALLDLSDAPQAVPVLTVDDRGAVAAVQRVSSGTVWHLAPGVDLTNGGLQGAQQGDLLPAILRVVPEGAVAAFDTYHLFGLSRVGEQIATLQDWLYRTPGGWATLFAALAGGLYLVLQGRRLGPPLVTVEQTRGRQAAEFVEAMANLHRRAREQTDLVRHQQRRLKFGLARRCTVSPDLPDELFLDALAHGDPPLPEAQQAAVREILHGLALRPGERQLVQLAAAIDDLLQSAW